MFISQIQSYKTVHHITDTDLKCVSVKRKLRVLSIYFMIVFIQKYFGVIFIFIYFLLNKALILNCNSKKRVFYLFMSILLISKYIVTLLIIYGILFIHKCKWAVKKLILLILKYNIFTI